METEQAMLFKIACGLHGNVTLFEATPQCLHKNSVNVSVSRVACDCEYAPVMHSFGLVRLGLVVVVAENRTVLSWSVEVGCLQKTVKPNRRNFIFGN